jgi:predicted ABC-type ATPase
MNVHTIIKLPSLILIRGLPGSGKSFLANTILRELGQELVAIIDPDTTDYSSSSYLRLSEQLRDEGVDIKFHPYRYIRAIAHKSIDEDKLIIWNQAFTNLDGFNKTILNLTNYAQDQGKELPLLVVEVDIDDSVARKRIEHRVNSGGHNVPDKELERFKAEYRSFAEEGYNLIRVSGEDSAKKNTQIILDKLTKMAS